MSANVQFYGLLRERVKSETLSLRAEQGQLRRSIDC
jgi:hypothetical protein